MTFMIPRMRSMQEKICTGIYNNKEYFTYLQIHFTKWISVQIWKMPTLCFKPRSANRDGRLLNILETFANKGLEEYDYLTGFLYFFFLKCFQQFVLLCTKGFHQDFIVFPPGIPLIFCVVQISFWTIGLANIYFG